MCGCPHLGVPIWAIGVSPIAVPPFASLFASTYSILLVSPFSGPNILVGTLFIPLNQQKDDPTVIRTAVLLAAVMPTAVFGGEPRRLPLHNQKIDGEQAWLTLHRPEKPNGTAIIICPGGGYGGLAMEPEGHGVARWLNEHGFIGLVLEYRMPRGRTLVPITDAQRALVETRKNAADWGINPQQVGIMGFSVGGHLASTAATHFTNLETRPDFEILIYPVITMGEKTHRGSLENLLGKNPSQTTIDDYSSEKRVTKRTPPTFLAHAIDDRLVPADNSRLFHDACQKNGVLSRYLELPNGGHGLSGYKGPSWDAWQRELLVWLDKVGH